MLRGTGAEPLLAMCTPGLEPAPLGWGFGHERDGAVPHSQEDGCSLPPFPREPGFSFLRPDGAVLLGLPWFISSIPLWACLLVW